MKKVIFTIALFLVFNIGIQAQTPNKLIVEVTDLENNNGTLVLDVFKSEKGFPMATENAIKRLTVKPANGKGRFVIENLPKGIYAFAVVHDENENGKLDTNMLGIPKEGACTSKNAKGFLSPPDFEDARFNWPFHEDKMVVHMIYF